MLKIENYEVMGWEHAIRGMRNPKNSWEKSDSVKCHILKELTPENEKWRCAGCKNEPASDSKCFIIGPNDQKLMMTLRNAGTDHRKFMRMITVYLDITAPLYWWKEFDTYKVGTVANSCSTMHKIDSRDLFEEDFSFEDIYSYEEEDDGTDDAIHMAYCETQHVINALNRLRYKYTETGNKKYWRTMIQLLPSSYNQKRTVMLNYEVLANIYKSRRHHKLDEWHTLCDWIESLPYSELITGDVKEK